MTITSTTFHAPALTTARTTFAASLVRVLARLVGAVAAERRIRRDRRYLTGASDHMLKDIGLARAEIGRVVRFGRLD